jgi:dolichyl-diphosphooligosaccharide--protein glycosyltransferase
MTNDWADSLLWLSANSPILVWHMTRYIRKPTFPTERGIWNSLMVGLWARITFVSKRIPVTSPFQDNVPPVARFLAAQSEDEAELNAKETGAKYIITDFATVTSKFAALPLWGYGKDSISRYQETYYQQSQQAGRYDPILILNRLTLKAPQ